MSADTKDVFRNGIVKARETKHVQQFEHTAMGDRAVMRDYEDYLVPIFDGDDVPDIMVISRDITERKAAEGKIRQLLAEKQKQLEELLAANIHIERNETLLKEVHHRVKNNMNTVASLLSLQARSLKEPSAITALELAKNRVKSLMVLYEKLYQSSDYSNISIKDYLPALVDEIAGNFPNRQAIKIEKHLDDFVLDAKRLQPLGMIINELLTNIMKYAFTDRETGLIIVSARMTRGQVSIGVQDNGHGMPDTVSFQNSTGFGLQLVHALSEQLDGEIRIERGDGTKVVLEFPL